MYIHVLSHPHSIFMSLPCASCLRFPAHPPPPLSSARIPSHSSHCIRGFPPPPPPLFPLLLPPSLPLQRSTPASSFPLSLSLSTRHPLRETIPRIPLTFLHSPLATRSYHSTLPSPFHPGFYPLFPPFLERTLVNPKSVPPTPTPLHSPVLMPFRRTNRPVHNRRDKEKAETKRLKKKN